MNVEIRPLSVNRQLVHFGHYGLVGELRRIDSRWKFRYTGEIWMKLSCTHNTVLLAAIEEPLTLLNITERLTS